MFCVDTKFQILENLIGFYENSNLLMGNCCGFLKKHEYQTIEYFPVRNPSGVPMIFFNGRMLRYDPEHYKRLAKIYILCVNRHNQTKGILSKISKNVHRKIVEMICFWHGRIEYPMFAMSE